MSRFVADEAALRNGFESAVREALAEANLAHAAGESGTLLLTVQIRLDKGIVTFVDAGVGFHRRVY